MGQSDGGIFKVASSSQTILVCVKLTKKQTTKKNKTNKKTLTSTERETILCDTIIVGICHYISVKNPVVLWTLVYNDSFILTLAHSIKTSAETH